MAAADVESCMVTVQKVRSVTPASSTHEASNMFLSTCDLVCRTYPYINRVFFYDLAPGRSHYEAALTKLEQSLSQSLLFFYPLAGRLSHDHDGRLHIECNDAGAELLEASLSPHFPFSHLLQDNFQYNPLFWKLAPKSHLLRSDYPHEPLLSVQVTSFPNGGLALGVSMSHIIADAQSFFDFMRCWAEISRSGSMTVPPKHIRTTLSVKEIFCEDSQDCKVPKNAQPPLMEKQAEEEEIRRPKPDLVQKVFPFSSKMLQQLKTKANASSMSTNPKIREDLQAPAMGTPLNKGQSLRAPTFTTFESFCAHWWQSIIKAKSLPPNEPVFLLIPVNCRQRFLDIPKSYFGNPLDGALVKLTAGELCGEELPGVAGRIHEAIVEATEERFKKYIKEAEENKNAIFHFDRSELFHIMDSPKFPIYDTDFGFGSPKAIRAEGLRYGCEVQIITSPLGPGGFDFFCALDSQSMHRLEHDPSFLSC